ncbi:MAG: hypothetical protein ACRDJN_15630 [Chloroflexota bacterium]
MAQVLTKKQATAPAPPSAVRDVAPEELMEMLDADAQQFLGISGETFLERWFGGHYAADPDQPGVVECAMLAPFVEDHWRQRAGR